MSCDPYRLVAGNGQHLFVSCYSTHIIRDLKDDLVDSRSQGNFFTGHCVAGCSHVLKCHSVNVYLRRIVVQSGGVILQHVCNICSEKNLVGACCGTEIYAVIYNNVLGIADNGRISVFYCRGVVKSKIVKVECVLFGFKPLEIETNEGRLSVGITSRILQRNVIISTNVCAHINPLTYFCISTVCCSRHSYTGILEYKVSDTVAGYIRCRASAIPLTLHSEVAGIAAVAYSGKIFRYIYPHTNGGGIETVRYVAENGLSFNVEKNVIFPVTIRA